MSEEEANNNINIDEDIENDDVVEFVFNDDGEEDLKATLKKLRKDIKDLKKEKEEYLNSWQRERADFANFKKDENERLGRAKENGVLSVVESILPALDSFDMAMANKETWEKVDPAWRMGIEYIRSQMKTALEDSGVREINPTTGSVFDPQLHESVGTIATEDDSKKHTIANTIQRGYKIEGKSITKEQVRIIRPARVQLFD